MKHVPVDLLEAKIRPTLEIKANVELHFRSNKSIWNGNQLIW